jgi:uncharacterized membrane protein
MLKFHHGWIMLIISRLYRVKFNKYKKDTFWKSIIEQKMIPSKKYFKKLSGLK